MEEKEYREKIIEMVNKINSVKVLKYIFIIVSDIFKEKGEVNNDGSASH